LDVTLNYRFTPIENWGTFNVRLVGGYLDELTFVPSVGQEPDIDVNEATDGTFAPKYVGTFDLTWTKGPLTLNYGLAWQGRTRRFTREQLRANPDLSDPEFFFYKERWEHDIQVAYNIDDRFTLYGGVNNFTNQQPAVAANFGWPVNAVGRFFYVGARTRLDNIF
jgi:iron complex outermembrane recepter protein